MSMYVHVCSTQPGLATRLTSSRRRDMSCAGLPPCEEPDPSGEDWIHLIGEKVRCFGRWSLRHLLRSLTSSSFPFGTQKHGSRKDPKRRKTSDATENFGQRPQRKVFSNVLTFQEQCFLSDQSHSKPLLWSLEKARSALGTFVRWLNVENGASIPAPTATVSTRFDLERCNGQTVRYGKRC